MMRAALDHFSSLLVGWVPDLSQAPPRRRVTIGVLASLALHLLFFGGWIVASFVLPERVDRPSSVVPSRNLEVELQPPPPMDDDAIAAKMRQILNTEGLQPSEKPDAAVFESDKDMRAGSQLPARGTAPLPTQDGQTGDFAPDFADQDVRISAVDTTASAASATAPPTPPMQQTEQAPAETAPAAAPPPLFTPQPVAREDLSKATNAPPEQPLPEPAKAARATPPPLEKVDVPRPDQIAVTKPSPETKPGPITRLEVASLSTPAPKARPAPSPAPAWMAMLSTPRPVTLQNANQLYQAELKKSRIDGEISNRGEAGVDAIATPAGRWEALTQKAIGRNWHIFVEQHTDTLGLGRVTVAFEVDSEGHTHDVHVEGSGGNEALEAICLKAIEETPIPPPPAEMLDPLPDHRVPQELSFVLY